MSNTVFVADLGGPKLLAALFDADGKALARKRESVDLSSTLAPVEQVARIAAELAASGAARRPLPHDGKRAAYSYSAAAVAVRGLVRRDGSVWVPQFDGWQRVPLSRLLKQKLGVPVVVESERNAAVLGETWRGAGRGKPNVVVLVAGVGIAAGIMCGGELLRGAHDLSGSAGWMAVSEADGFEVRKFGGLEAFASGAGIVRAARSAVEAGFGGQLAEYEPDSFTMEDVAELARRGDATARQIFRRTGKLLGLAAANLISLFDPDIVVLGGELAAVADLFWDELTSTALARCQPQVARKVRLRLSGLGPDANLLGAALLAWTTVLNQTLVNADMPPSIPVPAKATKPARARLVASK